MKNYRFATYGERYFDPQRENDFLDLEFIAPSHYHKRILADFLNQVAIREAFLATHTLLL